MAKQTYTITLYMAELLYDIENTTWLTGNSRRTDGNEEIVAAMQASADDEARNKVMRLIGSAFAMLKTQIGEYISGNGSASNNQQISASGNLTLSLEMPVNFNKANGDAIAASAHQYIVNSALSQWFNITDKADSGEYAAMAAANLVQIKAALNKRTRPIKASNV